MSNDSSIALGSSLGLATIPLVAGAVAWQWIIHSAPGPIRSVDAIGGLVLLLAGFLPLGVMVSWRPLAPMRTALAIAGVLSILVSISFRLQARVESAGSFVLLVLIMVLALSAHLLAIPRPRVAFIILAVLAVVGLYVGYGVELFATSQRYGGHVKTSSLPIALIGTACIAACWHGRRLLRDVKLSSLSPHSGER